MAPDDKHDLISGTCSHLPSQLSSEVSSTDLSDMIFFGSIILFVAGAIIARTIVIWGIIHNVRLVFCQILFVEGILLTGVSFYEMYFHALTSNREIILFSAF
jgi:hypothetical protein